MSPLRRASILVLILQLFAGLTATAAAGNGPGQQLKWTADPAAVDYVTVRNGPTERRQIAISTDGAPVDWTASTTTSWIHLVTTSGSSSSPLEYEFLPAGLAVGRYEGSIEVADGTGSFRIPMTIRITSVNVQRLFAHPTRQVVYALNTNFADNSSSVILELDAATAAILRVLPIEGFWPQGDLSADGSHLYLRSNSLTSETSIRIVDLNAWSVLPPIQIGTPINSIESLPDPTRFLTEVTNNNGTIALRTSETGSILASRQGIGFGGGQSDPTGRYYYHVDNSGPLYSRLVKLDLSDISLPPIASATIYATSDGEVAISQDGRRVFVNSTAFDSDLKYLSPLPDKLATVNRTGDLAVVLGAICWSEGGAVIANLPFTSAVAAISANDTYLVRYNLETQTIHSSLLAPLVDLPGPYPRPGQILTESPDSLSWSPVSGATSYRVYFATSQSSLLSMTSPTATVTGTSYPVSQPLAAGAFYYWRIDSVTPAGVITGTIRTFSFPFPKIAGFDLSSSFGTQDILTGASLSGGRFQIASQIDIRLFDYGAAAATIAPIQILYRPDNAPFKKSIKGVVMDGDKAILSDPSAANPLAAGGMASVYRENARGHWDSDPGLTLASPVTNQYFGGAMAASGNLLLVGAYGSPSVAGRVAAWITEPETVKLGEFTASDSVANDQFGRAIALEGNQAVITSTGGGPNFTRTPAVYFFSRSTSTGTWTQTQKLAIPNSGADAGTVVAISGNLVAINNPNAGRVEICSRGTGGTWAWSTPIARATINGQASNFFGQSLAISRNRLFVGDVNGFAAGSSVRGTVYVFNRVNNLWEQAPSINTSTSSTLGSLLSVDDNRLLAPGGNPREANIYRVGDGMTNSPHFDGKLPSYAVAGREFSGRIQASDADAGDTLGFQIVQAPEWMSISENGDGTADLRGVPPLSGVSSILQILVQDAAGNQRMLATRLTILRADELPVLTSKPVPQTVGEGQELALISAGSGVGPLHWQWFKNGQPISGATRPVFSIPESSSGDSGSYHVELTNLVGTVRSDSVTVLVNPPGRFAGDWTNFGNGPAHSGFHPALLGHHDFIPAWSRSMTLPTYRVVTGDGRIYVTSSAGSSIEQSASALDFTTGETIWSRLFPAGLNLSSPTVHLDTLYFQRNGFAATARELWALNTTTGIPRWTSSMVANGEIYESPVVNDDGIWFSGGGNSMYGFNLDGSQRFATAVNFPFEAWTPSVSNGRLFTWVGGIFQELHTDLGSTLWSLNLGWNASDRGTYTISAIHGDSAEVISPTEIACIDLNAHAIRWRREGKFQGSPAIAGNRVYAIQDKTVVSFDLADGTAGQTYVFPAAITSGQPLLTRDYLFVASAANTYVSELASGRLLQTLPGGGNLSFANGHLLVAGTSGMLRSWYARGRLEFDEIPAIRPSDSADDMSVDLTRWLHNPENYGSLAWELTANSNSAIFTSATLDQTGHLQLRFAPYVSGASQISIRVSGPDNQTSSATFEVILAELPAPKIEVDPTITFNRATGLYDQKVVVTNIAARAIAGFDLTLSGLGAQVRLYNGAQSVAGGGTFSHRGIIPAGAQVNLVLSYYAVIRGNVGQPAIVAAVAVPIPTKGKDEDRSTSATSSSAYPFTIERYEILADGSVKLTFPASPGITYRVQTSDDLLHWFPASDVLTTETPGLLEWADPSGATKAASSPGKSLFYRVERVSP